MGYFDVEILVVIMLIYGFYIIVGWCFKVFVFSGDQVIYYGGVIVVVERVIQLVMWGGLCFYVKVEFDFCGNGICENYGYGCYYVV